MGPTQSMWLHIAACLPSKSAALHRDPACVTCFLNIIVCKQNFFMCTMQLCQTLLAAFLGIHVLSLARVPILHVCKSQLLFITLHEPLCTMCQGQGKGERFLSSETNNLLLDVRRGKLVPSQEGQRVAPPRAAKQFLCFHDERE